MRYQVSGKQIDIGDALTTHVKAEISEVIDKYAQRATECVVVFSRSAHQFVCEAMIHLTTGLKIQASGSATEIYAAFEACRERLDKQIRRYKRRLRSYHRKARAAEGADMAISYIISAAEETGDAEPETLAPIIIAETETELPTVTVGEAVMRMELGAQRIFVFRNEGHGGVNVIYRREDGNIGWIDPRTDR